MIPDLDDIRSGDRRALARAITLAESRRRDHRLAAEKLLEGLLPQTGGAVRLGISGVPGVGKSTFIEAFGLRLIEMGKKVAAPHRDGQEGGGPGRRSHLAGERRLDPR
jgi:putative protein kinase ArgK-like GTPase of G3E family